MSNPPKRKKDDADDPGGAKEDLAENAEDQGSDGDEAVERYVEDESSYSGDADSDSDSKDA